MWQVLISARSLKKALIYVQAVASWAVGTTAALTLMGLVDKTALIWLGVLLGLVGIIVAACQMGVHVHY